MSASSVRNAIKQALKNGRVSAPEMARIALEAEKDGRVYKTEANLISRFVEKNYDKFSRPAQKQADSFFCRNELPLQPPRMTTFGPAGEEDGWGCAPTATTQAVGEEDGGSVTTMALGEEDGGGTVTTQA